MAASTFPLPWKLDAMTGIKRFKQNNVVREAVSAAHRLKMIESDSCSFSTTRNRSGTLRILALALFMLAAGITASAMNEKQRNLIIATVLTIGVIFAVLGYLHQWVLQKDRTIWWFIQSPMGHPVGAFVSRSTHAGFLAMVSPLALALAFQGIYANRPAKVLTGTASYVILTLAVASSLSRGALVAMGIGAVAFIIHSLFISGRRRTALIIPLVILSIIATLQLAPKFTKQDHITTISQRIATLSDPLSTSSSMLRLNLWADSLKIFLDYPMIGAGANAFRVIYPQYRTETHREAFTHTENEYLQILVDGGMVASALVILLTASFIIRWRHTARNRDMTMNFYGSGVFAGIIVAATHNLIDFPMHVPIYAFTLILLVTAAIGNPRDVLSSIAGIKIRTRNAALASLCAATICISIPAIGGKSAIFRDTPLHAPNSAQDAIQGIVWTPTSWLAWSHLYRYASITTNRNQYVFAVMCLDQAAQCDPNNYLLWRSVGKARASIGDTQGAEQAFTTMKKLRPWMTAPKPRIEGY